MSVNKSTMPSFRIDESRKGGNLSSVKDDTDNPDIFIKKMKSTMSKKKKNNYKNIEELENIYDNDDSSKPQKKSKKNTKTTSDDKSLSDTFSEIGVSLDKFQDGISSFKDTWNKMVGAELPKPANDEGFSNNFKEMDETIYTPDYEYDSARKSNIKNLIARAKSGKLSNTELKDLLNNGGITQKLYNMLLGFSLQFNGLNWRNTINKPPVPKCGPFNKECGDAGTNIIEYIKQLFAYFKQILGLYTVFLTYISTLIYKSVDGKINGSPSNSSNDVTIIVSILHFLIMIPLSIWFAYNWFFITFYKDETNQPIKIDFSHNTISNLKGLLIRFFRCLVQPMIIVDAIIRLLIPKLYYRFCSIFKLTDGSALNISVIGKILTNPIFIFIAFTLLILYMTCKYSGTMLDTLFSYMMDDKTPYEGYLHGIIAYDWIIGVGTTGIIGMAISTIEFAMSPLSGVFWFLVLVIFSHLMIRCAGIFMVFYLYIMSYFAMSIYSPAGLSGAMKAIKLSMESSIKGSDDSCSKGKWEKIILDILKTILEYVHSILYMIVLAYSVMLIYKDMKSVSAKMILGIALSLVIAMLVMAIALSTYAKRKVIITKGDIDIYTLEDLKWDKSH